jgi:hypothetical protein
MKRLLTLWAFILLYAIPAQAGSYITNPKFTLLDDNGTLASGACVYFYEPGTTTKKTIYTNQALSVAASNPTTLDSRGEASIFGSGTYKIVANAAASPCPATPDDITWTADNVGDIGGNTTNNVATIAALRGYSFSGAWPGSVSVQGYYAANDGGGGPLRNWVSGAAAGTYVDNGGSIIVPTGGDGSAAWLGSSVYVWSLKEFGAKGDGSTDDTDEINAAFAFAAGGVVRGDEGNFKISDTLTLPPGAKFVGVGACDILNALATGTNISVTHTTGPGVLMGRGSTIDGVNFWYPDQVTTNTPVVYDYTIASDISDTAFENGNNAGINIRNIVIHNAYNGILFDGDYTDGNPNTGAIMVSGVRLFAINIGMKMVATASEVNITDVVWSPIVWSQSSGEAIRDYAVTDGVACWVQESQQGAQFSNCTFFGHKRGVYLYNPSVPSLAQAQCNFMHFNGCIFDAVYYGVEVTDKFGLGGATFSGCSFLARVIADATVIDCIGFYSNNSSNINYVNFSGCQFIGTAGDHVKIVNDPATTAFSFYQFSGCLFYSANVNNQAGSFYNIYASDKNGNVQITGSQFHNVNPANVTNIAAPTLNSLIVTDSDIFDATSIPFNITAVSSRLKIKDNNVRSFVAGTWPSTVSTLNIIASAAALALGESDCDLYTITGTTGITSITASWPGRVVRLKFNSSVTVTDGGNLRLAGNFVATATQSITLVCDGTNWFELGRSAN